MLERLAMVGVSHQRSSLTQLGILSFKPEEIEGIYLALKKFAMIQDALILSTCNRVECYFLLKNEQSFAALREKLLEVEGLDRLLNQANCYHHMGFAVAEHLMRVCCGIDSMVLGEAQILGQVKKSFARMQDFFDVSSCFSQLLQSSLRVGARSRHETSIGRGAVSIVSAAIDLCGRIYKDFSSKNVVIVGAGETATLTAKHFLAQGVSNISIVNRTLSHAQVLADLVHSQAASLEALPKLLVDADIVVTAIYSRAPVITRALCESNLRTRLEQPLCIFDLSLPRAVEAHLSTLNGVLLYDLEAIERVVQSNIERRQCDLDEVMALIHDEMVALKRGVKLLEVGPMIHALRRALELSRSRAIAGLADGLSNEERERVDRISRLVVNQVMHGPTVAIRKVAIDKEYDHKKMVVVEQFFADLALSLSVGSPH